MNKRLLLARATQQDVIAQRRPTKSGAAKWLAGLVSLALTGQVVAQGIPFTEDFNANTFEDAGNTTADWNGGAPGQLVLQSSAALTGTLFDGTLTPVGPAEVSRAVALGDMDGDGDLDMIEGNAGAENKVFFNDGAGGFTLAYSTPDNFSNTRALAIGDVDGDGDLDWVEGNFNSDPARVYLNDGTGANYAVQDITTRSTDHIALADVNGDGLLDLILANDNSGQPNLLFLNSTNPGLPFGAGSTNLPSPNSDESKEILTGDVDNDGDLDIVMLNEGVNRVHLNVGGAFAGANTFEIPDPDEPFQNSHGGALGDMNGDGFLDLVVIDFLNGETSDLFINQIAGADNNPFTVGANLVDPADPTPPSGNPDFEQNASLADADNDGDLDIFVAVAGEEFSNRIYVNDGTGGIAEVIKLGADDLIGDSRSVSNYGATGDIDGDGAIDFVTAVQDVTGTFQDQPANNEVFTNAGTASGSAALQLFGTATSLQVNGATAIDPNGVRLTSSEAGVGLATHTSIDYWVSADGGSSWSAIVPGGRPVAVGAGNDLRWRADLKANSPANAGGLILNDLTLDDNASIPSCVDNGSQTEAEGSPITPIVANCTDLDGDAVFVTLEGLPANTGLTFDAATATVSGTPNNFDTLASPIALTFRATDGASPLDNTGAFDNVQLNITNTNDTPSIDSIPTGFFDAGPPVLANATIGVLYSYTIMASDPDPSDTLTITAPTLPAWLTLTDNGDGTALLEGTPSATDVANNNHAVSIVVADDGTPMLQATQDFEIIVQNMAPQFDSAPVTNVNQDAVYNYDIMTSDGDIGDTLTITADVLPAWLTFTDNGDGTANLTGTPSNMEVGDHAVELTVTDGAGESAEQDFTITVANVNDAPTFTSAPVTSAAQDAVYTYNVTTQDIDGDPVTITAPTIPAWLTFTDNGDGTGTLTGTPTNADLGDHNVGLVVSDGSASNPQDFTITVDNVNDAPSFTSAALTSGTQDAMYTYNITTSDPDGTADTLTITAPALPAWLTLTDNGDGTATLEGTPGAGDVGDSAVELQVEDAGGLTDTQSFTVTVANVNDAPTFTSTAATAADEDMEYLYSITTTDLDGDTVTISGVTIPSWLTLTDNGDGTAELRGTPAAGDVGDHDVEIRVEDGSVGNNQAFTITVTAAPAPPPPPPPSGGGGSGGGGSTGLVELLGLMFLGTLGGAIRRRRRPTQG